MPVMDGFQATRIIREHHLAENTPIIALTAHAMGTIKKQCLTSGMDNYLFKPISKKQFIRILKQYLKASYSQNKLRQEY